ncbi:MAG: hypothetical protein K9W45_12580 [Candidatus Heimdallarchaeum aukensis]|uniref:Uncharacterized protein n=1 Tax=Candidatus Heimdallarchaeum aukensis TaxID=2876573 RepID=A0A9Y1BKR9_9ARCH|nr:MAG: hypothetical protein K9W45_12580 [Candidatus Heimdallarchaeum aukensis]
MKKHYVLALVFIISLSFSLTPKLNISAQIEEEEIDWDYSGLIKFQADRIKFDEDSPIKLRYYYHLFYNEETETVESLVVLYGLRPIISAPYYSKFFSEGATYTRFSYWLNDSYDIDWIDITYESVTDETSENYAPEYLTVYNAIANNSLFKTRSDVWERTGVIKFPIHFANLSSVIGETIGLWEIIQRDGTIIRGQFTTYGKTNPIFEDPKSSYTWPDYNVTVAQDIERSSLPREHSVRVPYSLTSTVLASFALTLFLNVLKRSKKKEMKN